MVCRYVDVIVDVPALLGKQFTYSYPAHLPVSYGTKVRVPLGRGEASGFVVAIPRELPPVSIKPVKAVYSREFAPDESLLALAARISDYYCAPLAAALALLWPPMVPKESVRAGAGGLSADDIPWPDSLSSPCHEEPGHRTPAGFVGGSKEFRWREYVKHARDARDSGQGVVFLVPEVNAIQEAQTFLEDAFPGEVACLHSHLTGVGRREAYLELLRGRKCIALGTRSAVFAPVHNLGLIVLDDEPRESYKAPDAPYYDARSVSCMRGRLVGAKVLMGGAHPSVDAWQKIKESHWTSVSEKRCAAAVPVTVVDLKQAGVGRRIISNQLEARLRVAFSASEKAILFMNKRGDFREVGCRDCGEVMVCPRCQCPLAHHARNNFLICHTCGFTMDAPDTCPSCGGHNWRFSGYGIGRVLTEAKRLFPEVALFRLDKDVSKGVSAQAIVQEFAGTNPSCLVATSMVLGLPSVPKVAVFGALSCDTLLAMPDYRSSEKLYHLLQRAMEIVDADSSNAGFVAQTYNPGHHGVRGIIEPEEFYKHELNNRRELGYPPFGALFRVMFAGKDSGRVESRARDFASSVRGECGDCDVLGPSPAARPKVRGDYRWQVALRGPSRENLAVACRDSRTAPVRGVRMWVDVDPLDMT